MIIYGWRASHVKSDISQTVKCINCQGEKETLFSVFSRYFHIFWIPVLPYGRKGAATCQRCGYEIPSSHMDEDYKRAYRELFQQTSIPFWQFAGSLIIVALVSWAIISNNQKDSDTLTYLQSPVIGDSYYYQNEGGNYSIFKLHRIGTDSIDIHHNDYESTRRSKLYKIDKPENYTEAYYRFSKDELQAMFDEGKIHSIERD
ncbi:MAG: hypothetical protein WBA74_16895 [Cyclobacteriaceae bacterium]